MWDVARDETWALHGEHSNESPECFVAFTLGTEGALTVLRVLHKRWKLVSTLDLWVLFAMLLLLFGLIWY